MNKTVVAAPSVDDFGVMTAVVRCCGLMCVSVRVLLLLLLMSLLRTCEMGSARKCLNEMSETRSARQMSTRVWCDSFKSNRIVTRTTTKIDSSLTARPSGCLPVLSELLVEYTLAHNKKQIENVP